MISRPPLPRAASPWLLAGALLLAATALAQDSGALLNALIRKGILTNQEAEDIRADLVRENNTVPAHAMAGGKVTDRLSIGMRMQLQYAHIDTEINGSPTKPAYVDQPFTRPCTKSARISFSILLMVTMARSVRMMPSGIVT